jgi:hypothetical protein
MGRCSLNRLVGWRAGGGGDDRGTFVPASATSHIGWCVGVHGWRPQAAGDGDLMTAVLVAKNYVSEGRNRYNAHIERENLASRRLASCWCACHL